MKLAIATNAEWAHLTDDDKPLLPMFAQHGINAEPVIWNDSRVKWEDYDTVLIRSIWDYFKHESEFNNWLNMLEAKGIHTLNPVATIRQNHNKFYLQELQQQGVEIIPTLFFSKTNNLDLSEVKQQGWKHAVIKPAVSGGAYLTHLFDVNDLSAIEKEYKAIARDRDLLVQPFFSEIKDQGEISLLLFNRKYSHAVLKVPQPGDFRVQEQHGGITTPFNAGASIVTTADKILSFIDGELLYARVDGIMIKGKFVLMELELIEPFLFFEYKEGSREMFLREAVRVIKG